MPERYTHEDAVKVEAGYDTSSLKGKSVIVTGGASGLGEEMVRQFVQAGAFVTIGDVSNEHGNKIVSELGEDKVAFAHCNVLSWSDQVSLFKSAISRAPSKQIDIVVANAGIAGVDQIWQDDAEDDEPIEPDLSILKTNIIGVYYTAKLAIHYLSRNKTEGHDRCLIMTSSVGGYTDMAGSPQYAGAKWGVRGLMHSLRRTTPTNDIRVNTIAPWFVRTRLVSEAMQDTLDSRGAGFADKQSAGAAVLHIASDRSIHGRSLAIVPHEWSSKGYFDLKIDDCDGGDILTEWQNRLTKVSQRISQG